MVLQALTYKGFKFGAGHAIRTEEIVKFWKGPDPIQVITLNDSSSRARFNDELHSVVFVDLPRPLANKWSVFLKCGRFCALDWVERTPIPHTNIAAYSPKKSVVKATNTVLSGPEFAIIPQAEFSLSPNPFFLGEEFATVVLGGYPSSEKLEKAINFASTKSKNIAVFGNIPKNLSLEKSQRTIFFGFVDNLSSELDQSQFVITNSGVTLLQSLALKKQTFSWPQNSAENDYLLNFVLPRSEVSVLSEKSGTLKVVSVGSNSLGSFAELFSYDAAARIASHIEAMVYDKK